MARTLSTFAAQLREVIAARERLFHQPIEDRSLPDWDAPFNALALELFTLQFTRNPAYRAFCEARKVSPATVSRWEKIPAVPTVAFKEFDLTCLPPAERKVVFHSSGTTEQRPSRHFHNRDSLAIYEASLLPWYRLHESPKTRLIILTPGVSAAPHSSLAYMFDAIRRDGGQPENVFFGRACADGAWTLDIERLIPELKSAEQNGRPVALLGTAFLFVHLLDHLAEGNLRFKLARESRVIETGGYKGRSRSLPKTELHQYISAQLGIRPVRILCEYGMSELSSQAYDSVVAIEDGTDHAVSYFQFPPWTRAQVVSPETGREVDDGETGLLRVFDLANVFSVLAIQTEDLAIRRCDRFELIGRAALSEPRGCSLMTT